MPYGLPIIQYFGFAMLAFLSMAFGSHYIHQRYQPLSDLDSLIEEAKEKKLLENQDRK
ncbi:unnamed protein product [Xylocopa violacea]|uniref:Uncharacterized protein n=1 Tax=Xylocopa violacea TaxID=135666 RepID=A0ABP1NBM1_XYLVO